MAQIVKINGDLEVKKADVVVKARYKLNSLSLKFITTLISSIKKDDGVSQLYVFKVKEFKELAKLKRKDLYWAIKESLKELLEKPLYIPKGKNKDENSFLMMNWVSSAEYKDGEGIIEFEISNKLRPYLLEAKEKFLKYRLENILPLTSSYSIRIYEILKDWYEVNSRYGNKTEKNIKIDELRDILEIPKSYRFNDIKRFILNKTKTDLEKHTDIIFDFEEIKTGKKITHLKITIQDNSKETQHLIDKQKKMYLKTFKSFTNYLRKKYAGNKKTFFAGNDTKTNKVTFFGISDNHLLYGLILDKMETTKYNSLESMQKYEKFYKVAKDSELFQDLIEGELDYYEIFKENKELFNVMQQEAKEIIKK